MRNNYYFLFIFLLLAGSPLRSFAQNSPPCRLDTILADTTPAIWSPDGKMYLENKQDTAGVYQIFVGYKDSLRPPVCISIKDTTGAYPIASCWWWVRHWNQRNKMQAHWHPSGKWIICTVERECYNELTYTPYPLLLTFLETGWKTDMYATNFNGSHWYQLDSADNANGNGTVGPVFTPDGTHAAWAELQDSSRTTDKFGLWYMMFSEFVDTGATGPIFVNTKNINPPGSRWIEPGNFAPDGQRLMISSDIGMDDAEGQDQFIFNVYTGSTINLTNSPKIWDEHGVFSPDGNKIIFMSSFPYKADTNTYHTLSLKTEFMLIDALVKPGDSAYYPGREQLTHFNVPGYVESDTAGAVAAAGGWSNDGTEFIGQDLIAPNYKTWIIKFDSNCGGILAINTIQLSTQNITLFPNPDGGRSLYVKFAQSLTNPVTLKVLDITGRAIISTNISAINDDDIPVDVSNLARGMYFVQVITNQGTNVAKFIKQ